MTPGAWTDQKIIESIKAGGAAREKALYHVFFQQDWKGAAIAFVLKSGGYEADGDDIAQKAFVLFENNVRRGKFKAQSSLKTYFLAIARYQWYKEMKRRRPMDELQPEHYEEGGGNVEESYISQEKKEFLGKALAKLSERCQEILRLQRLGESLEAIARKVGLSSAAMAKKEAYRCRMRLRKFIGEHPGWRDLIL